MQISQYGIWNVRARITPNVPFEDSCSKYVVKHKSAKLLITYAVGTISQKMYKVIILGGPA